MKLDARKLSLSLSLLIIVLVNISCEKPPKVTPFVIDTDLQECREYEVIDQENFIIKFKESHPIEYCNGYWSASPSDFAAAKEYLVKKLKECQK